MKTVFFKYQIQASAEIFWLTGHNLRVLIAPTSAQVYYKKKKQNQIANHHYVMFCGLVCEGFFFFFLTISVFIIRLVTWNRTLAECISPVCY